MKGTLPVMAAFFCLGLMWGGCVNVMDFDDDTLGDDTTGTQSGGGTGGTTVRSTRVQVENRLSHIVLQSGDTATSVDLYGVQIAATVFGTIRADSTSAVRTVSIGLQQTMVVSVDSAVVSIPVCGGANGGFCSEVKVVLRSIAPVTVNVRPNDLNTVIIDQSVIPVRELVDNVTRIAISNKLQNVTIRTGQNQYYVLGADLYGVKVGSASVPLVQAGQTTGWTECPEHGSVALTIESMQVTYLSCFGSSCDTLQTTVQGFRSTAVTISKYLRNTVVIDKAFIESALTVSSVAP